MEKKIRPLYDQYGADGYYRQFSEEYENPHFPEIKALLLQNLYRIDCSAGVMDFSAGGGEVSMVLQEAGVKGITGSDPFTHQLYSRQTGLPCLELSFRDVIRNGLPGQYSVVISSFALHLCPEKELFPLIWNLLQAAPLLVLITPHKRPELEKLSGISLLWEDAVETTRGKKVRMKAYGMEIKNAE
ncbi:MAG TPA: hypothetical protein VK168_08465 [Saprospiraceae bacterium]|nr:hypothetical protein [Saprospiraceae bacterium]